MQSSIYIHELPSFKPDVQEVGLDLTASPSHDLLGDGTGHTPFLKSLEVLGMEWVERPGYANFTGYLAVRGSVEQVQANAPKLEAAISPIKRYFGSKDQSPWDREYVGRILSGIAQRDLPGLPENATLMRAVGLLADPLGEMSNADGCITYYARRQNTAAVDESGHTIPLYDVRDIGGLLIERNGRPAQERYNFSVQVSEDTYNLLQNMSDVDERPARTIIDAAMAHLVALDAPTELAAPLDVNVEPRRLIFGVNREHRKHLYGVYPEVPLSQLIATALSSFAELQATEQGEV